MYNFLGWKDAARWIFEAAVVSPIGYYRDNYGNHGYNELIYQHLLLRELNKHNLKDIYSPIGGAASYSLLYHIVRSLACVRPSQVLELGAGQSSLLLSACNGVVFKGNVMTIEQDKGWAEALASRVTNEVVHVPARWTKVGLSTIVKYEGLTSLIGNQQFEMVIVDGPTGTRTFSRSSILDHLGNLSPEKFIIIFDDINRPGEKQVVKKLSKELRRNFDHILQHTVTSSRHQTIFLHNIGLHELYLT